VQYIHSKGNKSKCCATTEWVQKIPWNNNKNIDTQREALQCGGVSEEYGIVFKKNGNSTYLPPVAILLPTDPLHKSSCTSLPSLLEPEKTPSQAVVPAAAGRAQLTVKDPLQAYACMWGEEGAGMGRWGEARKEELQFLSVLRHSSMLQNHPNQKCCKKFPEINLL
jgi:hypothetical protein